jgi:hypothetical protein
MCKAKISDYLKPKTKDVSKAKHFLKVAQSTVAELKLFEDFDNFLTEMSKANSDSKIKVSDIPHSSSN